MVATSLVPDALNTVYLVLDDVGTFGRRVRFRCFLRP